ncbi:helix-turn-helix domain-containing protein [Phocaeicola sp.]
MELINGNNEIIKDFFQSIERMLDGISRLAKENRPHLNGERFLSNTEVAKLLKVSIRTLQDWRDNGIIPYIQIKGKIIYRQSDIDRLLQSYYTEERQE